MVNTFNLKLFRYVQKKKKAKKLEPELATIATTTTTTVTVTATPAKELTGGVVIERKPKTEIRKPKKTKRVEEVDPILLRKRMRQLYKAVVNYQVSVRCQRVKVPMTDGTGMGNIWTSTSNLIFSK